MSDILIKQDKYEWPRDKLNWAHRVRVLVTATTTTAISAAAPNAQSNTKTVSNITQTVTTLSRASEICRKKIKLIHTNTLQQPTTTYLHNIINLSRPVSLAWASCTLWLVVKILPTTDGYWSEITQPPPPPQQYEHKSARSLMWKCESNTFLHNLVCLFSRLDGWFVGRRFKINPLSGKWAKFYK